MGSVNPFGEQSGENWRQIRKLFTKCLIKNRYNKWMTNKRLKNLQNSFCDSMNVFHSETSPVIEKRKMECIWKLESIIGNSFGKTYPSISGVLDTNVTYCAIHTSIHKKLIVVSSVMHNNSGLNLDTLSSALHLNIEWISLL